MLQHAAGTHRWGAATWHNTGVALGAATAAAAAAAAAALGACELHCSLQATVSLPAAAACEHPEAAHSDATPPVDSDGCRCSGDGGGGTGGRMCITTQLRVCGALDRRESGRPTSSGLRRRHAGEEGSGRCIGGRVGGEGGEREEAEVESRGAGGGERDIAASALNRS